MIKRDTTASPGRKQPHAVPQVLEISFDVIQQAMEDTRRDRFDYYLDRETGAAVRISQEALDQSLGALYATPPEDEEDGDLLVDSEVNLAAELPDLLHDRVEESLDVLLDAERFVRIPERTSSEAFETMKTFAGAIPDASLRNSLLGALEGKKAFRRFKDVLTAYPKERKQWNAFNALEVRKGIRAWLREYGIHAVRKRRAHDA